jgi:hypothetical protein
VVVRRSLAVFRLPSCLGLEHVALPGIIGKVPVCQGTEDGAGVFGERMEEQSIDADCGYLGRVLARLLSSSLTIHRRCSVQSRNTHVCRACSKASNHNHPRHVVLISSEVFDTETTENGRERRLFRGSLRRLCIRLRAQDRNKGSSPARGFMKGIMLWRQGQPSKAPHKRFTPRAFMISCRFS